MTLSLSRWCPGVVVLSTLLGLALGDCLAQAATPDELRHVIAPKMRPGTHPALSSTLRATLSMIRQQGDTRTRSSLRKAMSLNDSHGLDVFVYTAPLTDAHRQTLQAYGSRIHRIYRQPTYTLLYASVPVQHVEALSHEAFVTWITLALRGIRRTGSVTSAGDQALRADVVRNRLGVDGSGVRIGIISDSLADLEASVASGDLPADVEIVSGRDGGDDPTAIDEGRAMAEIIHDLAPGATLLFHSGFPTHLDMIAAIEALTLAGSDIIVDDLGFLTEPIFEDGPVAQAVQRAIDAGVLYVTAAGNSAVHNYRAPYREFDPNDADPLINVHDFGTLDTTMAVSIRPGSFLLVVMQWPDPFDGSGNTADYDLLLLDASGSKNACDTQGIEGFCSSLEPQLEAAIPPFEVVLAENTTPQTVMVNVVINRFGGTAKSLQLLFNGGIVVNEHNVSSHSIFGHPCVHEAVAVGAASVVEAALNTLEPFSSRGPCALLLPGLDVRLKPDLVGADGVNTTIQTFFAPFFGTSAAAPHVAGVAALLMELAGGPHAVLPSRIANAMRLGTVDRGTPGLDLAYGHGLADAEGAAAFLQNETNTAPESAIVAPSGDVVIAPGTALAFQSDCIDTQNGETFHFSWDFGSIAGATTEQNPGAVTFNRAGVFPIRLTCTDADGLSDPTPAVRTVTVNQPPQSRITSHGDSVVITAGSALDFMGICDDRERHAPFRFAWFFGGGSDIARSSEQNPRRVLFQTPGDFRVSFSCSDALGTAAPQADTVRVLVNPATAESDGSGGGCALLPAAMRTRSHPLDVLSYLSAWLLPLVGLRLWHHWQGRH